MESRGRDCHAQSYNDTNHVIVILYFDTVK